jgi:hypothetical protein
MWLSQVYTYVCIYIYMYIYIYRAASFIDFMANIVLSSHIYTIICSYMYLHIDINIFRIHNYIFICIYSYIGRPHSSTPWRKQLHHHTCVLLSYMYFYIDVNAYMEYIIFIYVYIYSYLSSILIQLHRAASFIDSMAKTASSSSLQLLEAKSCIDRMGYLPTG